jgi:hypothetical protein
LLARGRTAAARAAREIPQIPRFPVGRGGGLGIGEHSRQVAQILRLAVAIKEPAENPEHLDVPLQTHEVEPAQELRFARVEFESGAQQLLAILQCPASHPRCGPSDITILEQGHEVVSHRTRDCILEVDDPGIAVGQQHQVARVIITVHEGYGLRQRGRCESLE